MPKTIKLSKAYTVGDKIFDSIELREPTYADIFMSNIGEPMEWQPVGGGNVGYVVYPERVDLYLQKLIVAPGYEFISRIGAKDSLALKSAVLDFFRDTEVQERPPTSSSSDAGSMSQPSNE